MPRESRPAQTDPKSSTEGAGTQNGTPDQSKDTQSGAGSKESPAPESTTSLSLGPGGKASRGNLSGSGLKTSLQNLNYILKKFALVTQPPVFLPERILGTINQPNGSPGVSLQVEVLPPSVSNPATLAGSAVIAAGLTDSAGDFTIPLPRGVALPSGQSLSLRIRGSSPTVIVPISVPPTVLNLQGYVGTYSLGQILSPIPTPIYEEIQAELLSESGEAMASIAPPLLPKLKLGDDAECIKVLENQSSFERFPYGIFFQLIAPSLYKETWTLDPKTQKYSRQDSAQKRSAITSPISVDDFREQLLFDPFIVGSLGLGYVLRCSQNWVFKGLTLGDLVYSLPLAPGEQQQIVVEEQTTTLQVQETEAVYGAEQSMARAATDSSSQAVFNSALHQASQGGSEYNTASETGALTFGGGLVSIVGGTGGSLGETASSGSSHNWMDGVQTYASSASQTVQTYAEQESAAQRRAQRTSMRMATASERTSVTTKTVTNHNKLHALTMEYFEVLRHFEVNTTYDGVSLVCLVPMDVVWFLPPGEKEHLDDAISQATVSQAIQYASQLGSLSRNISSELSQVILFQGIPFFVQGLLNTVTTQLAAAVSDATPLGNILTGLGAPYATQATEANQLLQQFTQAQTSIANYRTSKQPSDLNNALTSVNSASSTTNALFQQLSAPATTGVATRQKVLQRYSGLLAHSDVLQLWLPSQYASGLTRLEKFAADPRASVALDSLAEDVIQFSANASVLPFDHIYVSVVTRWGTRIGPIEMIPNPPVSVPGQFDPSKAFKTSTDLTQYLQSQRNPSTSTAPTLTAAIAIPRTLSPSDVVGFEITHSLAGFTYQLQAPMDGFVQLFGNNGLSWPAAVLPSVTNLFTSQENVLAYFSSDQLAAQIGPPFLWNFRADLTATVAGNTESYVKPFAAPIELPPGILPIPAMEVSPILKYDDLILIESTLQHVLRNILRYSKAVWMWLTPEERVMLLEPYQVSFPGMSSTVGLLDCVANQVFGFYGNCMMMPFSIPQALGDTESWPQLTGGPMTTGELEDALLRFHRQSPPRDMTEIMLPTRGVLGEAMLGHCASGEKIDLTRFWNWQDSPTEAAPQISPIPVPGSQLQPVVGATAPNQLGGMLSTLVNNVNAPTVSPTDALATALAGKAPTAQFSDITGLKDLAQLLSGTQTTANQARQDQVAQQTTLTKDAIDQASAVLQTYINAYYGKPGQTTKTSGAGKGGDGGNGGG